MSYFEQLMFYVNEKRICISKYTAYKDVVPSLIKKIIIIRPIVYLNFHRIFFINHFKNINITFAHEHIELLIWGKNQQFGPQEISSNLKILVYEACSL